MPLIDLETAVDHILRACKAGHKKGHSPFFFLVGGGISFPPIPLASEIVEHCKAKVAKECTRTTEPPGKQLLDIYSHWFDKAYPQPCDRQEYLRELIEGKPVSHANLYLAHLLLEKTITNLVVTPNFDDFLSRALTLFGKPHIVCDHPGTVGRIHPDHDDIQIIHVHGTYWFYDCCNSPDEIKERSQSSAQTSLSMASLLDRIMWDRSPLVIGYGGWEGDVIMTALKRRLQNPLGHHVYWFCYRHAEVESLPKWLKSNPQVYFVVPIPQEPSRSKKQMEPYLSAETKVFSGKERDQTTLPAHLVLDKLIQKFSLESPELTRDPLGFFAEHLSHSLLQDNRDNVEDIYYIKSVIDGIKKAKKIYAEKITEIESLLEGVRDAMRRSQYREAIELANEIEINNVKPIQLRGLMDAMWLAAKGLSDNSKEELKGYDMVIVIGDILLGQNKDDAALRELVAKALVNKGFRLVSLNQCQEAIAVFDEVVKRFGDAAEPVLREVVAKVLVNKGVSLGSLNRSQEAIAAYDDVVKRFGEATEPALCEIVAKALVNKGILLLRQEKNAQACQCFSEIMRFWKVNQGIGGQLNFDGAEFLLKQLVEKSAIDPQTAKDFLSELELIASAPQPPEGIQEFLARVREILGLK